MENAYSERRFLHLMDLNEEIRIVKDILKPPLNLATKIITFLFQEEELEKLKGKLDEIKLFTAGIQRAENLSANYSLASYYPFMFAFHQYFHSAFRANQGKVLEQILQRVLQEYSRCDNVPDKNADGLSLLGKIFKTNELPNLDIDVMASDSKKNKTLVVQLRSRDDTGGTPAKGSLAELLRELLRTGKTPQSNILYLVCIWDPRDSKQKNTTVTKMFSSLKEYIEVSEKTFREIVKNKVKLKKNIYLQMAYGTDEIAKSLFEWIGDDNEKILDAIPTIVDLVSDWDDLWIAYALASLELEIATLSGKSNITILNEKYNKIGIKFDYSSYHTLTNSIENITQKMIQLWREDGIPVKTPADQSQYIRDLLFLKACHEKP